MTKWLFTIAAILILGGVSFGQDQENDETKTGAGDFADRFFIAATSSTYLDIATSKVDMVERPFVEPDPITGNPVYVYKRVPYQTISWSIVSFGLEPRYNIREVNKNLALAVSMPISFGLGITQAENNDVGGTEGLGAIQVPLLLKLYAGNHSTLDATKDFGFSFGGGFEYNKVGLIDMSDESDSYQQEGWLLPVGTFGFHFWRGVYPFEINVKIGVGQFQEYSIDQYGSELLDDFNRPTTKRSRSSSFKITFVSLLNY